MTSPSPATDAPAPAPTEEGIHFAYLLDGKGGGRKLDAAGVRAWKPGDGSLWILLDRHSEHADSWLGETFGLPELVRESLLAEDTRPRSVNMSEGLIAIMRGVNLNPGAQPDDMVSVRLWIDGHRAICLRGQRIFALSDMASRFERGVGPRTPGDVLVQLADSLADRMRDVVSNQEEMIDEIEDSLVDDTSADLRRRLANPRRQSMTLRRFLAPQREMTSRLTTEPTHLLADRDRMRLREVADELTRLVEDLDLLRERATMIQEQIMARASEQMNRTMYILSLVAAIFLPLGLLTGLLGVNVGGMPGADEPWAFWAVCGLLLVLAAIQWWIFRRRRLL